MITFPTLLRLNCKLSENLPGASRSPDSETPFLFKPHSTIWGNPFRQSTLGSPCQCLANFLIDVTSILENCSQGIHSHCVISHVILKGAHGNGVPASRMTRFPHIKAWCLHPARQVGRSKHCCSTVPSAGRCDLCCFSKISSHQTRDVL